MDAQPEDRPAKYGDAAEIATNTGTRRFSSRTLSAHCASGPASRFTWSAAVAVIMACPAAAQPRPAKCCSMAA